MSRPASIEEAFPEFVGNLRAQLLRMLPLMLALALTGQKATGAPNILFIMVDEMKWNVMSCAGHPLVKTPNLDRLAREGTRFATAYTVAPICTPSRYSFFTGRYAHVHGSVDNQTAPGEPLILLPALLKHHGYQTAISGKLHFIPANRDYGFDYFWSFSNEGPGKLPTWPLSVEQKHGRGAARKLVEQPFPDDPLGRDLGKLGYPKEDSQTFWITDRAVDFLKKRDPARPFFLFVSYLDPHSPSHLPEPYWNMFETARMPLPATFKQDASRSSATAANRHEVNDPNIVRAMTAAYYAKVTMVDDNLGRLLGELEKAGVADNTLIVFTADHGNMLGDLNRWFKGAMYEGSTRIPLLMKAPPNSPHAARFNRGVVVTNIVQSIDVMPTLCELAGVALPATGIQGRTLAPLLTGQAGQWKERAFAERITRMVRTPQYKLIYEPRGRGAYELYDLVQDPQETKNLAEDSSHSQVFKELAAELERWQREKPPIPVVPGMEPQQPQKSTGNSMSEKREKRKNRRK